MSLGEAIYPIEMLLVEDNPGDVRLTTEALKEAEQGINLSVVADGVGSSSSSVARPQLAEEERTRGPRRDKVRP